ncbi:hypothetical protein RBWH47_04969 [Rhodopirellula baltica WH47]|uniref:Uncharacterized protein n=1 Tax=Rhodopirellula baltica WH47 TaxID=991778 RepID=F2AVI6_RHOBT|nr:hypothetical protein RBWH47_04969 [Rhodopirellula baltica WH47]
MLRVPTFQLIQEPRLESRLLGESVGTCDVHAERLRLDYESDSANSNVAAQTETEFFWGGESVKNATRLPTVLGLP